MSAQPADLSYREAVQGLLRERLLDAAHAMIEDAGWSSVTMAKVAERAGVSRQTVYNELGTKHELAQALALRELDRFLGVVRDQLASHDDLVDGVRAGCTGVLEMAEQSLLVRTIVGSIPSEQDADFLQILTTESGEIIEGAKIVLIGSIHELYPPLPFTESELDVAIEMVVRLVLSAITRPSKPAAETAADISWILELALKGAGA